MSIFVSSSSGSGSGTSLGSFLLDGSKDVTTSGTRVQLAADPTSCIYIIITAKEANTGTIWVGGITVAAGRGRPLVALQSERIDIDDASQIYIDATVSGEGVTFIYITSESTSGFVTDDDGYIITDDDGNPIISD